VPAEEENVGRATLRQEGAAAAQIGLQAGRRGVADGHQPLLVPFAHDPHDPTRRSTSPGAGQPARTPVGPRHTSAPAWRGCGAPAAWRPRAPPGGGPPLRCSTLRAAAARAAGRRGGRWVLRGLALPDQETVELTDGGEVSGHGPGLSPASRRARRYRGTSSDPGTLPVVLGPRDRPGIAQVALVGLQAVLSKPALHTMDSRNRSRSGSVTFVLPRAAVLVPAGERSFSRGRFAPLAKRR